MEPMLAWLAGLLDGEGSIGINRVPPNTYEPRIQMSITHAGTVQHVLEILSAMGIRGRGYSYQEREPERQKDAHYLRINRLVDVNLLAQHMVKLSVTKRRQWELVLEFTNLRLCGARVDEKGRVKRGGKETRKYGEREHEIMRELSALNRRGPSLDGHTAQAGRGTGFKGSMGAQGNATAQFIQPEQGCAARVGAADYQHP